MKKVELLLLTLEIIEFKCFDKDGSFLCSFGSKGSSEGQFDTPSHVVVDRDGNIVISDTWNHRIQVMDIEGNFISMFWNRRFR